jgi:hypothetical protein
MIVVFRDKSITAEDVRRVLKKAGKRGGHTVIGKIRKVKVKV